jgi:transposase
MAWRAITDKQWKLIEAHLPKCKPDKRGGRPPLSDR